MTGYMFMGSNPAIFILAPPLKEGVTPYREDFALFFVPQGPLCSKANAADKKG